MNTFPKSLCATLVAVVCVAVGTASAGVVDAPASTGGATPSAYGFSAPAAGGAGTVQRGGMTLSEAVESVRRSGNVERVISAETTVENGREIHVIKVLTTDGKVRTHRIPGRTRD